MQLGRMVRLVAAVVLAVTVVASVTTPTTAMPAKRPIKKICPPSRCQLKKEYDAKLLATRKALAKKYKVSFLASRTLPVLTLMNSRRCRDGKKIAQPVHICWKEQPSKAFEKALKRTRAIIIRDEEARTGNCARCPRNTFLFATACCKPECDGIRKISRLGKIQNSNQKLKACCAIHREPCLVLKKNPKPDGPFTYASIIKRTSGKGKKSGKA